MPKDTELDRRLCPEHHADLVNQAGPMVYCNSCGYAYRDADLLAGTEM